MKPGPDIIIACPHCKGHAKQETLLSGNTFGASLWSDCKQEASMLPDFPKLVVCKHCNKFYWVEDAQEVDEIWRWEPGNKKKVAKWSSIDYIDFPTYEEYQRALESGAIRNESDEKYVRIQLWWLFNDHIRGKYSLINLFPNRYNSFNKLNIERLLDLLDKENTTELIMKAEIFRNLKRFAESWLLLESIHDKDYSWIKNKYLKAIEQMNTELFRLR